MKKAVAFRMDADLLAEARACARLDDRSLTNFVETAIRARVTALRAKRRMVNVVTIDIDVPPVMPPEPTDEPTLS